MSYRDLIRVTLDALAEAVTAGDFAKAAQCAATLAGLEQAFLAHAQRLALDDAAARDRAGRER